MNNAKTTDDLDLKDPNVAGQLFSSGDKFAARLVSIFGSNVGGKTTLHYLVDLPGSGYQDFEYPVTGPVRSLTPAAPAASWHEREVHERYQVDFSGHPALAPLWRHADAETGAWHEARGREFLEVAGEGVCEVPVGPVHAGTIEPGHFRFSVVGDTVLHLQLKLFYTHKGTETLFESMGVNDAVPLAESVSGDNCFAHGVAYCQAVEQLHTAEIPAKAGALRLIGLEVERLLAHIGDFGALCGDVGFSVPAAYCARIKEDILQASARAAGTRYWRGLVTPGGMRKEIGTMEARHFQEGLQAASQDFLEIAEQALNTPSLEDRFEGAGILERAIALDLGVVGPVARACGIAFDIRSNHPDGAYNNLTLDVPTYNSGDVMARARVRIDEARTSSRLVLDCLGGLPDGPCYQPLPEAATGKGFATVESPRGELLYWLQLEEGRIRRCHVRSPSFQNWPALPFAVAGNIIADFPLINKSFNLSYSGCDR